MDPGSIWMDIQVMLIAFAGTLGAMATIIAFFRKPIGAFLKSVKMWSSVVEWLNKLPAMDKTLNKIDKRTESLEIWKEKQEEDTEFINQSRLVSLKQAAYNENLPYEERCSAAKQYLDHGGNGFTKTYYEEVLKPAQIEGVKRKTKKSKGVYSDERES